MEPTDDCWGERLHAEDRRDALEHLDVAKVDADFIPYVERINRLPFVVTHQCCVGHMAYEDALGEPPENHSAAWGYLQLLVTPEAAEWLTERARAWSWLGSR